MYQNDIVAGHNGLAEKDGATFKKSQEHRQFCQNPNLGFKQKLLNNHNHYHNLNVRNITAITDPILMKLQM